MPIAASSARTTALALALSLTGAVAGAVTATTLTAHVAAAQESVPPFPTNQSTALLRSGTQDITKSVRDLQGTLTELQALQLQTKQAHWNVSGTLFWPLHEMLQEHYEGVAKYADEVAERLIAVGSSSDGRAPTIVQTSRLPEIPGGFLDDARVIPFFMQQYAAVGDRVHGRIKDLEQDDPTSANLLQEVEHAIEKYQWQMRAHFQPTPTDANAGADINGGRPVAVPRGNPTGARGPPGGKGER